MKRFIGLAALALVTAAPPVLAQGDDSGNWLVRGRVLNMDPANKGIDGLSVSSKTFPEVDIVYFFTPNIATELVLTYPQKHDVRLSGAGKIGTVKHLPPTLMLQYHVTGLGGWRPYVGAGLNYTLFSSVDLLDGQASLESNSAGWALGAGVDVPMGGGWMFNVDLKKVKIRTDVGLDPALLQTRNESPQSIKSGHTNIGTFKIDPVLFSIGIGKRF
jgi:outer membrane protein